MTVAFLFVAVLLLMGVVLRQSLGVLRWLFIPASVVAGLIGLVVIQAANAVELPMANLIARNLAETLAKWPGFLIAIVFAGMLLESTPGDSRGSALTNRFTRVGKQGLMVWIIVLGETAVGLLATWLLVQSYFDVPNSFGMLIETGFAGGHGTAAAMGQVYRHPSIDLPSGQDLGVLMATFGLVYGVVSGIGWINLGARLGWIQRTDSQRNATGTLDRERIPIGIQRIDRDTIDPLLLQVIWLALAFGIGLALQSLVSADASWIDSQWIQDTATTDDADKQLNNRLTFSHVLNFPLFIYTLFGGLAVRKLLTVTGHADKIDNATINRLTSTAMEILVVAAIASLNLELISTLLGPFMILFVTGAIWTAVCLLLISRWILPADCWFQLGLINYGMSTGTTATGFVLLRVVDPQLKTQAATDYALAAPLSAPFIGGGMITVALPLLVLERVPIAWPATIITGIVVALILTGRLWNRNKLESRL
ncbi:sodium/glutamate symporter [Stieleria varia]|uniref:Sodium/glutamate symporter n=1 Tax=Stieleria varia TaxID=2528005 RepID=A0A5C6B0E9_9BACT|nr:sodium/glutamate symporter [Stieleria varia]TWU05775.1 Sodium/glutamate symporter [Stieleria varia]